MWEHCKEVSVIRYTEYQEVSEAPGRAEGKHPEKTRSVSVCEIVFKQEKRTEGYLCNEEGKKKSMLKPFLSNYSQTATSTLMSKDSFREGQKSLFWLTENFDLKISVIDFQKLLRTLGLDRWWGWEGLSSFHFQHFSSFPKLTWNALG